MGGSHQNDHGPGSSCARCQKALPPDAKFCRRCGFTLHPLGSRLSAGWILTMGAAGLGVSCLVGAGLYYAPGRAEARPPARGLPKPPLVAPVVPREMRLPAPAREVTPPRPAARPRDPFHSDRPTRVVATPEPAPQAPPATPAGKLAPPAPPRTRPPLPHDQWRCDTKLGGPGQHVAVTLRAPCTGIISAFELNVIEAPDSTGDLLVDVCRLDEAGLPDERAVLFTLVARHRQLPPIWAGGVRGFDCDSFDGRVREGERLALVVRCGPGGVYRLGALSGDPAVGESFVRNEGGAWSPAPREADVQCTASFTPEHLIGQFGRRPAFPPRPRARG